MAEIEKCLKRLYLYLANSNLADSHDEEDYEKGDMEMPMGMTGELDDEKIVCKFAPVSQKIESDKNGIL